MKTLTHLELDLLSQFVHQRHYLSYDRADDIQSISLDYSAEDGYEIKINKSKGKRTSLLEANLLTWFSSTISYAQATHKITIDKLVIAYDDETYTIELATSPQEADDGETGDDVEDEVTDEEA